MDASAMFKLSYGLFVVGCEYNGKLSGCIINTAAQSTAEPNTMLLTMMKTNNTAEFVRHKGSLTVSVLSINTPLDRISDFGMRSSRDCDKFAGIDFKTDDKANPYLTDVACAVMFLSVKHIVDLDTHYLFVCRVDDAEVICDDEPMTYKNYRDIKCGKLQIKNNTEAKVVQTKKTYVCPICHYVYDGDIPFEELPDDWECPSCHAPKSVFTAE